MALQSLPDSLRRGMKKILLLSIAAVALAQFASAQSSSTTASSSDADVIAKEKAVWEMVKNNQVDAFKKNFASDYTGVYSEGIKNVEAEAADVAKVKFTDYALSDTKVTHPDAGSAVITYKCNVHGTMEGKDISGSYNMASVWVKKGSDWQTVLHTEVKAE
ncbi:MAG: nuclear transport factor 2 family protein [Chthoniobacterales bacterium]